MMNYIETPKISEILSEEFMLPMGISAYQCSTPDLSPSILDR